MFTQHVVLLSAVGLAGVAGFAALGDGLEASLVGRAASESSPSIATPELGTAAHAGVASVVSIVDKIAEAGRRGKRLTQVGESEVALANLRLSVRTPDVDATNVNHILLDEVDGVGSFQLPNTEDFVRALAFHFEPGRTPSELTFSRARESQTMRLRKMHDGRETVHTFVKADRQDAFRGYWSEVLLREQISEGASKTTSEFNERGLVIGSHEGPLRADQLRVLRDDSLTEGVGLFLSGPGGRVDHVFKGANALRLNRFLNSIGPYKLIKMEWDGSGKYTIAHHNKWVARGADDVTPSSSPGSFTTKISAEGEVVTTSRQISRLGHPNDWAQLQEAPSGGHQLVVTLVNEDLPYSDRNFLRTEFFPVKDVEQATRFLENFQEAQNVEFVAAAGRYSPSDAVITIGPSGSTTRLGR